MKILVLNCGSSSVKYKLYEMPAKDVLAQGVVEKLGLKDSFLKMTLPNGEKVVLEKEMPEHTSAVEFILENLTSPQYGCIKSFDEINAVGHRLVHGGEAFKESVLITDEVIAKVNECIDLAPLHNPPNLKGIDAIKKLLPSIPQVGVFDTAFQQSMEPHAFMYALPYRVYEKYGVRRYGFHGTSHRYVSKRACEILGKDYNNARIITCHIGNGASMNAIKNGKVIDTTMGLTPTEGLMMGTRCGDVDPGALAFIMGKENLNVEGFSNLINKESGVFGVSGISSDMRDIENAIESGNERAKLAMDMYNHRIKKYIGAFMAELGGCDIIIFTGGVGENQTSTREIVCAGMEYCGIELDNELNAKTRGKEIVISKPSSKVTVMIVPTDEELMIATDTLTLAGK
ncbi:Acetate kinase [Porphyromonas cangingivalis]|uniref:Acetate kinase n=1 Tax=Porphyromonas cangingivalis TaxID=36874 RepID=A0A099WU95_PORCN|nr:acetate kinase [Porphyromonas cangingivalis]KGL48241.1 acetate kinase [Porphyromonas cangingivalis]KGN82911.1 acetate kinase [Porphyromonas cangingivalis]SPY35615.1 Acetate kinase [Porphyromonas cangingivalis]